MQAQQVTKPGQEARCVGFVPRVKIGVRAGLVAAGHSQLEAVLLRHGVESYALTSCRTPGAGIVSG